MFERTELKDMKVGMTVCHTTNQLVTVREVTETGIIVYTGVAGIWAYEVKPLYGTYSVLPIGKFADHKAS